jgi:hypothetical protein
MDEKLLRKLVSEMVIEAMDELDEEEELDEFSGVGAIAGYTLPLGMKPKVKKNKKLGEAAVIAGGVMPADSSSVGGFDDHLPKKNNNKRINFRSPEQAIDDYETSVEKLARSFGGSDSPFGKRGSGSHKRVVQFLTPKY